MSLPGGLDEDDYTILKRMAESGMIGSPKVIAANTNLDHDRVKHRVIFLKNQGLLKQPDDLHPSVKPAGLYELTELGEAYGSGDMTINELQALMDAEGGEE